MQAGEEQPLKGPEFQPAAQSGHLQLKQTDCFGLALSFLLISWPPATLSWLTNPVIGKLEDIGLSGAGLGEWGCRGEIVGTCLGRLRNAVPAALFLVQPQHCSCLAPVVKHCYSFVLILWEQLL